MAVVLVLLLPEFWLRLSVEDFGRIVRCPKFFMVFNSFVSRNVKLMQTKILEHSITIGLSSHMAYPYSTTFHIHCWPMLPFGTINQSQEKAHCTTSHMHCYTLCL